MKQILFILAFLFSCSAFAQGPVYVGSSTDRVINKGYFGSLKGIINAIRDTNSVPLSERTNGLLIIGTDSSIYVWKASTSRWLAVSGAGAMKKVDSNINGGYASYYYVNYRLQQLIDDTSIHVNELGWGLIRIDTVLTVDSNKVQTAYGASLKADKATTISINGTSQSLAANRTFNVGTVTSVAAGTGLSGGTITGTGTISMPSVGTAGTYGSTTTVPIITTDAQGRVSSVSTATIAGATGTIYTFVETSANANYTIAALNSFVTLAAPSLTTGRTVTLPAGSSGATLIITNYNTTANLWVTSPSYKTSSGGTTSALANGTTVRLIYDGNASLWKVW